MVLQYTALAAFSCAALLIMMALIRENARMKQDTKDRLYQTYVVIILANIIEAASIWLNGAPSWTHYLHLAVKGMDYCLTPLIGLLYIRQIQRRRKWILPLLWLLFANIILQIISFFTGWVYYVDSDNYYHHGPLYLLYILVYGAVMIIVAWQFILYSRRFKSRNRFSLQAILLFVIMGIAAQEILGARINNVTLTIGAILLFLHNNEYAQQNSDSTISQQRALLETDALTGMKSRFAYNEALNALDQPEKLPENTTVFMIDINGLKMINDQHGHSAGDELICGVAQCISEVLSPYGECYRTGGDEFVAILFDITQNQLPELCAELTRAIEGWRGEYVRHASISYGYVLASEYPKSSVEELIRVADERMYSQKASYYKAAGRDRRKR